MMILRAGGGGSHFFPTMIRGAVENFQRKLHRAKGGPTIFWIC